MDQTFITIHNLAADANILYASDTIVDILGYTPADVLGQSTFDFFHPEEVPFARSVHNRGVLLDKAAVLKYVRVRSRDGQWVCCECCFTIVHDVLVACTSIYRRGEKSDRRAIEAPQIRRIFSCSPRDPRYHMLEHLSSKFTTQPAEREPRAAMILNRFTRSLTVMFATEAVHSILGVTAEEVTHKSFYECIGESSLGEALNCLESAKANESIAYLRFWSRDPRRPEDFDDQDEEENYEDEAEDTGSTDVGAELHSQGGQSSSAGASSRSSEGLKMTSRRSSDSDDGGVKLNAGEGSASQQRASPAVKVESDVEMSDADSFPREASSGPARGVHRAAAAPSQRTARGSNVPPSSRPSRPRQGLVPPVELEAVVSCASDGLVVVLRRARPSIPTNTHSSSSSSTSSSQRTGVFAAPWGLRPIQPQQTAAFPGQGQQQQHGLPYNAAQPTGGPLIEDLMSSIRDVAVFAWPLVGINGHLESFSQGTPIGNAQPRDGLPIWDPSSSNSTYLGPENQAVQRWGVQEADLDTLLWEDESGSRDGSGQNPRDRRGMRRR